MKRFAHLIAFGLALSLAQPCSTQASAPATDQPQKTSPTNVDRTEVSNQFAVTNDMFGLINQYEFTSASEQVFTLHPTVCSLSDRVQLKAVGIAIANPSQPGRFITRNTYADDHPASGTRIVNQLDQPNDSGQLTTAVIPLLNYIAYMDTRQRLNLKAPGQYQASLYIPSILNRRRYKFNPC